MFNFRGLTGQTFGDCELRELIGVTKKSAVYLGNQTAIDRLVAVKVMNNDPNPDAREKQLQRFFREARIAAGLEHPNIVPIYDFGSEDNIQYVIMRLLRGGSLEDRINERLKSGGYPCSLHEAAALLQQIGSALDYAHEHRLIHRDIKPNNIMFDAEGRAYLVDFGFAKALDNESGTMTMQGVTVGTASYMAPEQWRGDPATIQIDQYALGVVMYSLIAGKPIFDIPPNQGHVWMYKHLNEAPEPLHEMRPDAPPELSAVLQMAMAKEPHERYGSLTEFSNAFTRALRNVPKQSTDFFTFPLPKKEVRLEPPTSSRTTQRAAAQHAEQDSPSPQVSPRETLPSRPVANFQEPSIAMTIPAKRSRLPLILSAVVLLLIAAIAVVALVISGQNADETATPTAVAAAPTQGPGIVNPSAPTEEVTQAAAPANTPIPAVDHPLVNTLIQDGGFETPASNAWEKVGSPETDCSGGAFEGDCVAKVNADNQLWQRVDVDPALHYALTVAARSDETDANLRMQIEWYDANGTRMSSTGATQPVSGTWSEYVLNQIQPPENTVYAQISLRSQLPTFVSIDGVSLEPAA